MKNKIGSILVVVAAMLGGAVFSYFMFGGDVPSAPEVSKSRDITVTKVKVNGNRKTTTVISLNRAEKAVKIEQVEQLRPGAKVETAAFNDEVEEENLTDVQKAVLKDLQDALDDNDLKQVRKTLSRLVAKVEDGGLGGNVPVCMRARAVEALGWFGKDAAIDLISYVADANEDVAADAFSKFEMSLTDCEMSDTERSMLVSAYMKTAYDADQIDSLLTQLNDMRNSVKANTARDILASGTDKAKAMMTEQLESYFDDGIRDVDGINRWQAMNQDE